MEDAKWHPILAKVQMDFVGKKDYSRISSKLHKFVGTFTSVFKKQINIIEIVLFVNRPLICSKETET